MLFHSRLENIFFSTIVLFVLSFLEIDCRPKVSLLSPKSPKRVLNGKDIVDVESNTTLRLKCEGSEPFEWLFPSNDPYAPPIKSSATITRKRFKNNKYTSEVTLNLQYLHTGLFSCYYVNNRKLNDSIYVFVNDPDNLIVPYEGSDEFMILPIYENSTNVEIPCKPTDSRAEVSLHLYDTQTENFVQMPNNWLSFDPTLGFTVKMFSTKQYNAIDCRVRSNQKEQYIAVTIHLIKHSNVDLYPSIDVTPDRTAIGDNITLICSVNIEANTFIDIVWHFQDKSPRKKTSLPESVTKSSSEGVFETVSRSLTIINAKDSDSGTYVCNVSDIRGRQFTAKKNIVVADLKSKERNQLITSSSISGTHHKALLTKIALCHYIIYCIFIRLQ